MIEVELQETSRPAAGLDGGQNGKPEIAAALLRESAARRFRTLGHPVRLRIIELLARGNRTVSELAQLTRLPADTVSKHLRALAGVNVVRRSQQGNFARYALCDPELHRLVALGYRGVMREVQRMQSVAELGRQHGAGGERRVEPDARAEGASRAA